MFQTNVEKLLLNIQKNSGMHSFAHWRWQSPYTVQYYNEMLPIMFIVCHFRLITPKWFWHLWSDLLKSAQNMRTVFLPIERHSIYTPLFVEFCYKFATMLADFLERHTLSLVFHLWATRTIVHHPTIESKSESLIGKVRNGSSPPSLFCIVQRGARYHKRHPQWKLGR